LAVTLPAAVAGLFWPVAGITRCRGDGYSAARYLAYCEATEYRDYEHVALYDGLEPAAIRNLDAADILVIGNSRAQVAFSTDAVDAFAARHGWRLYRLGFGFDEESAFAERLLRRYHLRPRVIIINVDPFFTGAASIVATPLLSGGDRLTTYAHGLIQRLAQDIQRATCGAHRLTWATCGEARTIYRSRDDGTWDITDYRATRRYPAMIDPTRHLDMLPRAIDVARQFLSAADLPSGCVLLTSVPSNFATPELARQIADALALPLILAPLDGLSTFDLSHLDAPSAERWSAGFVAAAAPFIQACMAETVPLTRP
jgi:hypothetical protein